jgi:arylsulfatase A-like enzyme
VLERPVLTLVLYPLAGAALGAAAGVAVERLRRLLRWRVDGWVLVATAVGLGTFGLQTAGSIESRLRQPWLAIAAFFAYLLLLLIVATTAGGRIGPGDARRSSLDGVILSITTFTTTFLFLALLDDRIWVARLGGLGMALVLLCAGGALAAWLALELSARRPGPRFTMRRSAAGATCTALLLGGLLLQRPPAPAPRARTAAGPNVLLIVLDTLRRDAVSLYGLTEGVTPQIDRYAERGVIWEDAIVPANWTLPGHASLFTGAAVTRHGTGGGGRRQLRLAPGGPGTQELPTIAEVFRNLGWYSVGFVNNVNLNRASRFDRGFVEYHELWRARQGNVDLGGTTLRRLLDVDVDDQGGELTLRAVESFLGRLSSRKRPWFAFINFLEPHAPYAPPEPWTDRFTEKQISEEDARALSRRTRERPFGPNSAEDLRLLWQIYLGDVAYQDHLIGRLMELLEERGELESTIVWITSDHGETFGWRGQLGHGKALNDDLIRVPLIAWGPGIPRGVRDRTPASIIDVLPTLLTLVGAEQLPADRGRPGIVLPPVGSGEHSSRARIAERYEFHPQEISRHLEPGLEVDLRWSLKRSALLVGPWKVVEVDDPDQRRLSRLVKAPAPPGSDGRIEVHDEEMRSKLLADLAELRDWVPAIDPLPDMELDDETRRELEALGYVAFGTEPGESPQRKRP